MSNCCCLFNIQTSAKWKKDKDPHPKIHTTTLTIAQLNIFYQGQRKKKPAQMEKLGADKQLLLIQYSNLYRLGLPPQDHSSKAFHFR